MKNILVKMLFPVSIAILISGCNKEVTVEDGIVLNSTVVDSSNKKGISDDNTNLYKFRNFISYPVYAKGGFIDLNEDGIYNKNIESKLQFEMQASKGKVITAVTTLLSKMTSSQINSLKKDLEIDDLYKLPSEDKKIYILSELIVEKFITKETTLLNNNDIEDIKSKFKGFDFKVDASLSTKEFAQKRETVQIKKLRDLGKIKEVLSFELDNQIPNIQVDNIITAFEGESISLDASNSTDIDGNIVSFLWKENNLVLSNEEIFVKNDFSLGSHTITLVVTDDKGAKASDVVVVNIEKKVENIAPIAKAGNDRSIKEGESVIFDGSLSSDIDGEIVSYEWLVNDIVISNEKSFSKNDFEVGAHNIKLVVTDNKGLSSMDSLLVEVTKNIVVDNFIKIHEIQGENSSTPMANKTVEVEAIVIADYQDKDVQGFYIQEEDSQVDNNENTSEGIFVYDKNNLKDVNVGDKVRVTGTATEFYNLTQIKDLTNITIVSSNNTLPSEKAISLPMESSNSYEKYEGMLVKYTQDLNVTDLYNLGKYGEILLTSANRLWIPTQIANPGQNAENISNENKLNQIILDDLINGSYPKSIVHPKDGLSKSNVLRIGDKTSNLKAVMSYGFNKYRLLPIHEVEFTQSNPRPDTISVDGNLKVASINVLNYFRTIDDGSSSCGSHLQGCRGADSIEERDRQNAKMIVALQKMDADIIGLMEIENDGGITAKYIADSLDGYDYVRNPNGENSFLGDDVITVAFLYKKDKVQLVGNSKTIANGQYQSVFDTRNRKPLAQTFKHIETNEVFTVINNHYKSKGSGCGAGDDSSNGQGNCNGTRTKASQDILTWIEDLKASINDNDFLIIGDLNAYAKEDPIVTLENGGFNNLDGNSQTYSYVYYGQAGTLDYALASATLNAKVKDVKRWFINSDEAWLFDYNNDSSSKNYGKPKPSNYLSEMYEANEFRMSDHDPIIVGFDFKENSVDTNKAPIANAGVDATFDEGEEVLFDGSLSSDIDGSIISYEWKEGNEVLSNAMTFTKSDLSVGVHNITLIVTDDKGITSFDNIVININSTSTTPPTSGKVFISEYVEGGGNNKAIEIYNGTDKTILMSDYKLLRYSNGKTSGANINLDDVYVNANEVFVIVNSSANSDFTARANQLTGSISHNGDDAYSLVLKANEEVLDVFGQIGFDPGSSWNVNLVSTKDRTLRRKTSITSGDTVGNDIFDPSLQWDSFPKDTYDGLGSK